jgi:tRNA1Val (adenine37-N6)-methyltransferase
MDLRLGERLDDLGRAGLRIIQHPGRFPFALDPVLLAHFATIGKRTRALDLGTGSGVIPLLLVARHPGISVSGLELQPELAEMAARSVALNRLEHQIRIDCGDYRQVIDHYGRGKFDLVTMNPPYRETGRGLVSPSAVRAAARFEVSGSLRAIMDAAATSVKFGGRVAMVFVAERLVDLFGQMRAHGLEPKRLRMVHPRFGLQAKLLLVEAVKGGGTGLIVEPPLVVYGEGQAFTPEMQQIYSG